MDQQDRETTQAWRLLVVAHDRLMKVFESELKRDFELTVAQYDVLHRLTQAPDQLLRMSELARILLYSSGAATKVIDRLVERGLVTRTKDDNDRRAICVRLTADGTALVRRAQRAHGRSIAREVGPFTSAAEQRHVTAYLTRLAQED